MSHRPVFRAVAAAFVALLFAARICAAEPDGPYVLRNDGRLESWSVEVVDGAARRQVRPLAENATITVPAVGGFPAFPVKLRAPVLPAQDAVTVPAKAPVFIVADTHGEFEILAGMLQKHAVLDARLQWAFGRGQLVVLGDVFDRGPNHLEILWLLYGLEAQAKKAGGGVHFVLGNHETMVMRGDLRYLHPKYRETVPVLGVASYDRLFDPSSVLGQWLRSRATVMTINDQLYLHGGISRALIDQKFTLAGINTTLRKALEARSPLDEKEQERAEFLLGSLGPLWYRGYFADPSDFTGATPADVDLTLDAFEVHRILVGHTTVPAIAPLYGGKVIAVQVYPKRDETGQVSFECLLIRDGKLLRAKFDGGTEPLIAGE